MRLFHYLFSIGEKQEKSMLFEKRKISLFYFQVHKFIKALRTDIDLKIGELEKKFE